MRYIFIVINLFFFSCLFSQSNLKLDDCLDYAFENNNEVLEHSNNIKESDFDLKQAYLNLLPSVNAEFNHYMGSGRSLDIESYSWENEDIQQGDMTLATELILFNGLYNFYNKEAAKISVEKSKLEYVQRKLLLGLEITVAFHRVFLTNSSISILKLTNLNTNKEIQKLGEQIKAGTLPKSNIYELEAQSKKEELEILSLQNESEKQIINLSELLNWKEEYPLKLDTNLFLNRLDTSMFAGNEKTQNLIVEESVITLVVEQELRLAENAIKLQKSYLYPTLSANASFSSWYQKGAVNPVSSDSQYTYFKQLENNQYKELTLTLSIPIFNRYKNSSKIEKLRIDYENKILQLEDVKNQLCSDVADIQTDISFLIKRIKETKEMVKAYEKAYETATDKYHSGLLDSFTLNTSKNNYTTSMLKLNKLQVELSMNIALLKQYREYII